MTVEISVDEKQFDETDREIVIKTGTMYAGTFSYYWEDQSTLSIRQINDNKKFSAWVIGGTDGSHIVSEWLYLVALEPGEITVDLGHGRSWHIVAVEDNTIVIDKLEIKGAEGVVATKDTSHLQ